MALKRPPQPLPALNPPPGGANPDRPGKPPSDRIRVLLVDDDAQLVELGCRMLDKLGFAACGVSCPQEALALVRHAPASVEVLLTDLTMPGMSGIQLATSISALRPGLPMVLCSGMLAGTDREAARRAGIIHFLVKPFAIQDLALVLLQAVRGQRTS